MDYFAAIRAFVRSADLGSFSKAASVEGIKVSTVSRYISGLEADLGAALFNRSTRSLHLTEAGSTFYEKASKVLTGIDEARNATISLNARPQGVLRINVPTAFGRRYIMPLLPEFLSVYPDIRIDATLTDTTVDLIETGTDIAIRIGALSNSTLIAKRLAPHWRVLVASPHYLRNRAPLVEPEDILQHDCLLFSLQPNDTWYFTHPDRRHAPPVEVKINARLRMNDSEALLGAAVCGLGVSLLPNWLVNDCIRKGKLVKLLPEWTSCITTGPERAIWGVYPPKKIVSPKVRSFLNFFSERFGQARYWSCSDNDANRMSDAIPGRFEPNSLVHFP
jgi:DNA-binding transcriptional LysR family regulator